MLSGTVTASDTCVRVVVTECASWTDLNTLSCCVGVGDDGGGDAASIAITVELVVARKTLSAIDGGNADITSGVTGRANINCHIVVPLNSRTGKHAGIVGSISSIRNGTLPHALICD